MSNEITGLMGTPMTEAQIRNVQQEIMKQQQQINRLQKVEFGLREMIDMMLDALLEGGGVPADLKKWADDREWALRLVPKFRPPEKDWNRRTVPFGEVQRASSDEKMLLMKVPHSDEPQRLFAVYRAKIQCFRDRCDSDGLRYVLEVGRHYFCTVCFRCNVATWKVEEMIPMFVLEHLIMLNDVRQLTGFSTEVDPWSPVVGDGATRELDEQGQEVLLPHEQKPILLPGQPGFQ